MIAHDSSIHPISFYQLVNVITTGSFLDAQFSTTRRWLATSSKSLFFSAIDFTQPYFLKRGPLSQFSRTFEGGCGPCNKQGSKTQLIWVWPGLWNCSPSIAQTFWCRLVLPSRLCSYQCVNMCQLGPCWVLHEKCWSTRQLSSSHVRRQSMLYQPSLFCAIP